MLFDTSYIDLKLVRYNYLKPGLKQQLLGRVCPSWNIFVEIKTKTHKSVYHNISMMTISDVTKGLETI